MKLQKPDSCYNHLDVLQSVQYFPLNDKLLVLRTINLINMIESAYPVSYSVFLYNEQIAWSGINHEDLYSIYEYMLSTLFPKTQSTEFHGGSILKRDSFTSNLYGNFITGLETMENCMKAPKMFINNDKGESKQYHFLVYKALSGILCMFVETSKELNEELFAELHSFIGPRLVTLASDIGEDYAKTATVENDSGPKYLFFNHLNFTHQGSIPLNSRRTKNSEIPQDISNLLVDLFDHGDSCATEETIVKTLSDFWIVRRISNYRHFYVILNKSSTLLEATEEAKKLYDQHLKKVYFDTN